MGFCVRIDRSGAGILSPAIHCLVSIVDGRAGRLVRVAMAWAAMESGPKVVAEAHTAKFDGQYHSVLTDCLGGADSPLS